MIHLAQKCLFELIYILRVRLRLRELSAENNSQLWQDFDFEAFPSNADFPELVHFNIARVEFLLLWRLLEASIRNPRPSEEVLLVDQSHDLGLFGQL
jgi:hypothetical protein